MPYIKQSDRQELDPLIDKLADQLTAQSKLTDTDAGFAGLLNYTVIKLTLKLIKLRFGKLRYWIIATVTGTFKNVSDEFYRRLGTPYENKQINKNGDVDLYQEFEKEINQ